ncbi:MAG: tetratricopeptide repeat protein, partial [Anaerolineae bacterium]|nr:tetratricopeptide repeat protein [Anaerolineae bacterium]
LSRRALEQLPEEDQFVRTFATWLLRTFQLVGGEGMVDSQSLDDVLRMSQRAGNVMLSVMVVCNRAELLMRQGQLHEAAAAYRKALELATDAQGRRMPIAGQALIGLGDLSRQWGDLDAAVRYLLEGIELTEQWSEVGPLEAYICLARIRWAQGDVDGAWQALEKAQELAVKFDLTDLDDLTVAMFQAWMCVAQGDLGPARRWAEERDLYQYVDSPLQEKAGDPYDHRLRKYELLVPARLLIAQGQPAEALKMLESLVPLAEWRGRPGMLIEIYALQALAYQAQGNVEQAMAALERALSLAEPEGHVRIFADEGEPMARLLQEAARRGIAPGFVNKSLAAFGVSKDRGTEEPLPSPQAQSLPEPLSARELKVLRLLNTHLSSTEIAEELFISVNTARFHIKNIYGKLGVHGRSEAVQRARELGLL